MNRTEALLARFLTGVIIATLAYILWTVLK